MALTTEDVRYEAPRSWIVWTETVLGTLAFPLVGFLFDHHDPLLLKAAFPWLIFAPLLFGVRYGFLYGVGSALLTILIMLVVTRVIPVFAASFPYQYALAAVLVGGVSGEFSDSWLRRLQRLQLVSDYDKTRIKSFTRSYLTLKISHDQLEERLAGQKNNLRDAFTDLHAKLLQRPGREYLREEGEQILEFLAVHAHIQQGYLYSVLRGRTIEPEPLAQLGQPEQGIDLSHPMIVECMKQHKLIGLRQTNMEELERKQRQKLMAVVPLIDVHDRIWALVLVTNMPFILYHDESLKALALIGSVVGDVLRGTYLRDVRASTPRAIKYFKRKFDDWTVYTRRHQLESNLIVVRLAPALSAKDAAIRVDNLIFEQLRETDYALRVETESKGCNLLVLLPMTPGSGAEAYTRRIRGMVELKTGHKVDDSQIAFRIFRLPVKGGFNRALEEARTEGLTLAAD